jgi:hypothetical protein
MNTTEYAREARRYATAQRSWDAMHDPMQEYGDDDTCRECHGAGCEECDGVRRCVGDSANPCDGCGDCKEET